VIKLNILQHNIMYVYYYMFHLNIRISTFNQSSVYRPRFIIHY